MPDPQAALPFIASPIPKGTPARLTDLKPGMGIVISSADWGCLGAGTRRRVMECRDGLYVRCRKGRHLLDGQEDEAGGILAGVEIIASVGAGKSPC